MKKCIKCGEELLDNAKFCPTCGSKQNEEVKVINIGGKKLSQTSSDNIDDFFSSPSSKNKGNESKNNEEKKVEYVSEEKESNTTKDIIEKETQTYTLVEENKHKVISDKKEFLGSNATNAKNKLGNSALNKKRHKDFEKELEHLPEGVISYEIIDESIFIDDPFSSHIDYEALEKEAQQQENVQKANKMLKSICYTDKMYEALYSLSSPHVIGMRCLITGNDGSNKEVNIQTIAKILKLVDKIDTDEIIRLPFGKMPEEWDVRKLYVITDLKSAIERLFNLEDVSDEANVLQQEYVKYMNRLLTAPKSAYIILNGYIEQVQGFITLDARIRYVFAQRIDYPDLTNDEIYNIFYESLPEFHRLQLPDSFKYDFNEYLTRNKRFFPFRNKELAQYLAQTSSKQAKFELPKEKYNASTLDKAFSTIIGMNNVKDQVYELQQYLKARKDLEAAGAKLPAFHMHMMFLGNPGVGKTTIARIISKVLFDLGYIREEKLIEVTSKDLVGNGNQTGIKTNKAILSALGGVLFVDEAYSLARSCGQAGDECIATLIKAMEDYKADLVCMYAGYTLEMNDFVKANSGMQSRIAYTFTFLDYTAQELYEILELKVRLAGMSIAPDAVTPIKKIIEWGSSRKNFGNGRFIDKLFQNMLTKHATLNLPKKEILVLRKASVPTIEEIMQKFGRFMG